MWQQNQSVGGKDRQAFIKQAAADRESRQRARDEKAKQEMELKAVLVVQRFARLSIAELRAKKKAANALDALVSSAPVQTPVPIPKRDATKPTSESTTKIPDKTVSEFGSQSVTDVSAKDLYDAIHTYLQMVAQRSARVGWIAQVSELLSVVLTRLSTLRVTATPHIGGSLGKFKTKSQKDVAATQSGIGSQQLDGSSIAPGESNGPLPQPCEYCLLET
ncbi:hypothetical protein SARC_01332 [Sphaeroforma arctica JP610]|uniref:Uncharacterized protein n=1 Tax=Sphaeroforma arctica JP610 TaxID=667725 RepID=A0A0L0GBW2_9EUKA|nr:hypothetical protein SARC_01332 [Sphaeroforma arctica JP610]KNC86502.1 hypothetical protein SARC_01332 [Sphaeroforma arctica JP610]|eukprot:XP_014160404.1 hypothetical protein SARC_01332 [Sphaeroforma arctica JP610]